MNYFEDLSTLTFTQPFDSLASIILFVSILICGYIFSKKIKFFNDSIINLLISTILVLIFLSFALSILVIFKFDRLSVRVLIWILIFSLIIYFSITYSKKIQIKFIFNELTFILFLFLLISLIPPTDADSLDYHLGFPLEIIRNEKFIVREDWYHSRLAGIGENLVLLGLLTGSKNFGQIINFFGLVVITLSIRYISLQYKSNLNYFYYIFSTPLLIWIVSSQKLTLLTSSIICLVVVIISVKKSLNNKVLFFIYSSLSFCIFTKVSNFVPSIIIFSYLLYLFFKNKEKKIIYNGVIILFIFVIPYFLRNYYLTGDIYYPFLEYFREDKNIDFLEFYKSLTLEVTSFSELKAFDYILVPLHYSIPFNILRPTILLGLGIILLYPVLLNIKNLYKKFEFIFIFLIFTYIILIPSIQPRYFLEAYWVIAILILKYNIFKNYNQIMIYFNNLLKLQTYFLVFVLLIGIFYLLPGSLNNKNYHKVMKQSAYNYNLINWIHRNVPKNSIVVSNAIRSHALYKNKFISREGFFRSDDLINETKRKKVNYFILEIKNKKFMENKDIDSKIYNLIINCGELKNLKYFNYKDEVRNKFSKLKNINRLAVLIKNKCI